MRSTEQSVAYTVSSTKYRITLLDMLVVIKVILTILVVSVALRAKPEFQIRVIKFRSSAHGTAVHRPPSAVRRNGAGAEGTTVNLLTSVPVASVRRTVLSVVVRRIVSTHVVSIHVAPEISPCLPLSSAHSVHSAREEEENNRARKRADDHDDPGKAHGCG